MKAVRFIAIFSFLVVFNLVGISVVNSQDTKDIKTDEKSSEAKTETVKPVVAATVQPVQIVNAKEERYRIGLHDVIDITISRHPELSQPYVRIDENGRIRLPRIDGSIVAICKTENELANEIRELYAKNYLRDPFVSVVVKEQNSQPLSVIGAVKKPGSFYTNRRLTLLDLLSFAGGPDIEFAGTKVQVARVGGISGCVNNNENTEINEEGVIFFSYTLAEILKGKTNPVMRPGDIVVVLEAEPIYVTGNVFKPQAIPLKQEMSLTQAIASAGGMLPSTKKSQVRIIRQQAGSGIKQELIFDLNAIRDKKIPDPVLQANDIVDVPTDKFKEFSKKFFDAVTGGVGNIIPYRVPAIK